MKYLDMSRNYKHSILMSVLKRVDEKIKDNYSSAQYMEVWDALLYNALDPILKCSNLADIIISDVLHFYTENHRRKVSSLDKEDTFTTIFLFLVAPQDQKLKRLKAIKLERSILRLIISTFLDKTDCYQELHIAGTQYPNRKQPQLLMDTIEKSLGYTKEEDLFLAINAVKFWNEQACEFKNQLLEKYTRLIVTNSQSFYDTNNSKMSLDDIIQNIFLFSSKALDKYDPGKGTLTPYIQSWMKHAKNVSAIQEDGTAFLLPNMKRSEVENVAVSLDDEEALQVEDESSNIDLDSIAVQRRVQLLAKVADPTGLGRVALGISEILTKEERLLQSKQVLKT